jgi:hypothetical protein
MRQFHFSAVNLSEQAASHGQRGHPHQAGETQAAEHGGRAEILNAPDLAVPLACDVIGEFFDSSVEEFYGENDEQGPYHGSIPSAVRGNWDAKQQPRQHKQRFIAERWLGLEAVDQSAKRILSSAVKSFQDCSED